MPDGPGVLTSEEGWKLDNRDTALVNDAVARLKRLGARVILFIDPNPNVIDRVPGTGADGVEIYTGSYADAFRGGDPETDHGALRYLVPASTIMADDFRTVKY